MSNPFFSQLFFYNEKTLRKMIKKICSCKHKIMIPREKLWHLRILPVLFPTHNIITEIMNYTRQRLRGKQICWWMKKQKTKQKNRQYSRTLQKIKKRSFRKKKCPIFANVSLFCNKDTIERVKRKIKNLY